MSALLHRRRPPALGLGRPPGSCRRGPAWPAILLAACGSLVTAAERPLAFPGAEGWGRLAAGGRGGEVVAVTTLADDGPGSLRDALRAGHRTVVFRVSGTIDLESELVLEQSCVTIAGQTAPGGGICLRRFPLRIRGAHDVIVRHLRIRVGDEAGRPLDGLEVRDSSDVIVDHCSVSWSIDEAVNTWHGVRHLTVQWCLIAEPLDRSLVGRPHGFAATLGGRETSYHHNLFAHAAGRNPSIGGGDHDDTELMDYRNNVIYNWRQRTCDGKPRSVNVVSNYYKPGPATLPQVRRCIARIDDAMARYGTFEPRWHIEGNVVAGAPELTADNWRGGVLFEGATDEATNRQREPFPFAPVATQPAEQAAVAVLADAGATRPARDAVDARVLREVAAGTAASGSNGIIDRPGDAGGWPLLESAAAPADSDADGMPDAWEEGHGLDPHDAGDRNGYQVDREYTNLECHLNELAAGGPGTSEVPWIDWYRSLAKPAWTPAPRTIGLIWQILYPVIIVTFGGVFVQAARGRLPWQVALPFAINLVANLIFTPIQFGMRNLPLAAVDILVVWGTIVWMMLAVWPHHRWVAVAQVPYFVWVSIATVLQLSITWMNRA